MVIYHCSFFTENKTALSILFSIAVTYGIIFGNKPQTWFRKLLSIKIIRIIFTGLFPESMLL